MDTSTTAIAAVITTSNTTTVPTESSVMSAIVSAPLTHTYVHTKIGKRWQFDPLAIEFLKVWVTSNGIDEYPSVAEKQELCGVTGIAYDQISNVLCNVVISVF